MAHCVVDSSAALSWVLPGEATHDTDALLTAVGDLGAVAPGLWPLEIANVLWQAERRGRLTLAERTQALAILGELPIRIDERTAALAFGPTSVLAAGRGLTVYDACYLELALRLGLPLASLDNRLCDAAFSAGVSLILPRGPTESGRPPL
jgi:predicted nucleic acid-binding protein